jgi:diguanylate cyclase (GGDEF)-like protein/PAS domain S-box-containing protein
MELPFGQVVDLVPEAVIIARAAPLHEPGPEVVYVNPAWEALTGYTAADIVGSVPDIAHGLWSDAEMRQRIRDAFMRGTSYKTTLENTHADGTRYWVEITVTSLDTEGNDCYFVAVERDITDQVELKAAAKRLASTDPITGVLSRKAWLAEVEQAFALRRRYDRPWTAVLVDLDGISDFRAEHDIGATTRVIQGLAERIAPIAREQDVIGRFGHDDFAILLPETTGEDGGLLAERIREAVERAPIEVDGSHHHFTASIGLVEPGDDRTVAETIARFEHALAEARERGGNTIVAG